MSKRILLLLVLLIPALCACRLETSDTAGNPEENHRYTTQTVIATCTQEGYTLYTCVDCGYSYKDGIVPKKEHNYKRTVCVPTCTEKGYTA